MHTTDSCFLLIYDEIKFDPTSFVIIPGSQVLSETLLAFFGGGGRI